MFPSPNIYQKKENKLEAPLFCFQDRGDEFTYTGSGGRDLSGNKRIGEHSFDQTLTHMNRWDALKGSPQRIRLAWVRNNEIGVLLKLSYSLQRQTDSFFIL